ncbi:GtrA family protein [Bacillus sp. RG28]|uniref:GtrA family protein n=1 Tax=Gottfriedia endophytica TaxID=2820819 RepID=A0A940NQL7_9BACI|nr:GtrA family protein [Gottfriedia endophytica]MBP0726479.1 GtrA family protein [Gottfriedia endophytica]
MKYSFIRFLMVGIINTIVGLSIMYALLHLVGFSYWISTFIGNTFGATVSYFLNRMFTFRSRNAHLSSVLRFVLVIGLCYFLSYFIGIRVVKCGLAFIQINSNKTIQDLSILVGTGLYTILNYFGQKVFVFREYENQSIRIEE